MGIWDQLSYLHGRSLKTLVEQKPFEITEISESDVTILPYATLEARRIKCGIIEGAWLQLTREGTIAELDIREHYSSANFPFITAT